MTQSRRVFLAHAREDKERVRALYKQIKQRGFSPWLDEEDLISGQIWETEIQKAIRQAGAFIACLSQISVQKQGGAVGEVVGIRGWRNLRLVQPARAGVVAPAEITP